MIESLRTKVDVGELEAEIHKVVAANIWLIRDGLAYWFDNRQFASQLAGRLAAEFKLEGARRPDLVCLDNSSLGEGKATRLLVVEFKRPGVTVGYQELAQVMAYKSVFMASLAQFSEDDIDVIVLGDTFDGRFDRSGLGPGYRMLSYLELLTEARARYRDLYDRLVPEGTPVPGVEGADLSPDDDEEEDSLADMAPRRSRRRRSTAGA